MAGQGQRGPAEGGRALNDSPADGRRLRTRGLAADCGLVRVLEGDGSRSVNEGRGIRSDLASLPGDGRPILARYDLVASTWPVRVAELERHPGSDQVFVALDGAEALVVVAPSRPDGELDLAAVKCFRAAPGLAFLYPAGLWHAPLFALERPGRFLMAMRESGDGRDTEIRAIDPPFLVGPG